MLRPAPDVGMGLTRDAGEGGESVPGEGDRLYSSGEAERPRNSGDLSRGDLDTGL